MARIAEISYMKRTNLGNYEHEEITATVVLDEGDDAEQSLVDLKAFVAGEKKETPAPKTVAPKKSKAIEKEEEIEEIEEVVEEDEEEEVKPKAKAKTTPAPKKKKSKATPYDREEELHKTIFGDCLTEINKKWRTDKKLKLKAQAASRVLNGADFLDADGEVLESFKESLEDQLA